MVVSPAERKMFSGEVGVPSIKMAMTTANGLAWMQSDLPWNQSQQANQT